jgi:Ni/Fe-hydrogenase subunit HybB-like protein
MTTLRAHFWRVVAALILSAGLWATVVRFTRGLGAATHLSDEFPWGLWIGFDILCGVGLAAGGFAITATVHIFHLERFRPILRPTILTAFLGYMLVIVALMYDLGRPWSIWHAIVFWNPHSVMFEVAWCVMLYTTVLFLEFSPMLWERLGWLRVRYWLKKIAAPLVGVGVILSTLHQSSLGSLYLIVPTKLHPLWYSPLLPVFFFISSIAAGMAMVIFESGLSSRAFGRALEFDLLRQISRVMAVTLGVYLLLRFQDLGWRGQIAQIWTPRSETWLFWLETALLAVPMVLCFFERVRSHPQALFGSSLLVIAGFLANRLNVSVTGLQRASGVDYFPSWMEVAVTLSIVTVGFLLFRVAVKYLAVFEEPAPARTSEAPVTKAA